MICVSKSGNTKPNAPRTIGDLDIVIPEMQACHLDSEVRTFAMLLLNLLNYIAVKSDSKCNDNVNKALA